MSHRSSLITTLGRSLATQLDHLRQTLDNLGLRLRDAVTHAVGETVGAAVRQTLHAALAADSAPGEKYDRPVEPRYRDPPAWPERQERSSWGPSSWDAYSGWHDAEDVDNTACPEGASVPEPEGPRGAAAHVLIMGCQAAAWWLRRHSARRPLLAAVGVGAACAVAAYLGGPVVIAGVGLAGSALGLATLADAARASARALAGPDPSD